MVTYPKSRLWQSGLLGLGLACLAFPASAWASEKEGMPDLSQIEQTCLPTSTANLMIWFGKHGYPKLILSGDNEDDRALHVVHVVMADTDARFDWGTQMKTITIGIDKYIKDAGYDCDVEYRGIGMEGTNKPFTQDWLKENDEPNKGFILLLAYVRVNYFPNGNLVFTRAINAGHAVTLVNAEPDMILIHDPAHETDETGRKILTPEAIPRGTFQGVGSSIPVSGLLLLSGSLLGAPPDAGVMLTGAVCVTMHPAGSSKDAPPSVTPSNASHDTIAGGASGTTGTSPSSNPQQSQPTGWWVWLFNLVFRK